MQSPFKTNRPAINVKIHRGCFAEDDATRGDPEGVLVGADTYATEPVGAECPAAEVNVLLLMMLTAAAASAEEGCCALSSTTTSTTLTVDG